MGLNDYKKEIDCILAMDYKRKNSGRLARIPVKINKEGKAEVIEYHGSAHVTSFAYADGLISIPIGMNELKKGTIVNVRQI